MTLNKDLIDFFVSSKHFFSEKIISSFFKIDDEDNLILLLDLYQVGSEDLILSKDQKVPTSWYIFDDDKNLSFLSESPLQFSLENVINNIYNIILGFLLSRAFLELNNKLKTMGCFSLEDGHKLRTIQISGKMKITKVIQFSVEKDSYLFFDEESFFYLFNSAYFTVLRKLSSVNTEREILSVLEKHNITLTKDSYFIWQNAHYNKIDFVSFFFEYFKKRSHKILFNKMFHKMSIEKEWLRTNGVFFLVNPFFSDFLGMMTSDRKDFLNLIIQISKKKYSEQEFILRQTLDVFLYSDSLMLFFFKYLREIDEGYKNFLS